MAGLEAKVIKLLTPKEAGEMLCISDRSIYAYVKGGKLKALRLPCTHASKATKWNKMTIRIPYGEIERFITAYTR